MNASSAATSTSQARHAVLILDANQRSALAVTRSLGRDSRIKLFTADATPSSLAGSSRFTYRHVHCPSSTTEPDKFLDWLVDFTQNHDVDYLCPVTETTSQLCLMARDRLHHCKLPFTDLDTLSALANKWRLVNLAEKVGVPYPRSQLFSNGAECLAQLPDRYPVVVKPCTSRIWLGDSWLNSAVHVANSPDQLRVLLAEQPYLQHHPFMLQEFIPGHGAGIFALYDQGQAVTFFAHRRIREKPPGGGVSVFSESVEPNPRMLELAKRLLDAVGWHGVAMVEFRVTPSGEPFLMEVNTRFWGSLQLAIDAGVDFPHLLYRITCGEQVAPVPTYHTGRRLRWLLGDLDSLYLTLRDRDQFSPAQKWRRLLDFLTPDPRATRHEVNRWSDPAPAWHELRQYLSALRG